MPKILKHNFSISGSMFIDFLVAHDFLERQSFTIPVRAFEWAEARTILACFSPTLDFAIASQHRSNHPPGISPIKSVGGQATKQAFVSTHIRCFFLHVLGALHPEDHMWEPLENQIPGMFILIAFSVNDFKRS